jgi:hypothetical protein
LARANCPTRPLDPEVIPPTLVLLELEIGIYIVLWEITITSL